MHLIVFLAAVAALAAANDARSQPAWRPDKPVEIVIPTAPGGNSDRMVRLVQRALQDRKLVSTPVIPSNRPGGNQTLALTYVMQRTGDAHALFFTNPAVFTNELSGVTPLSYTGLTPIALLLVETNAITVKADAPFRSMRDLTDRLRTDPEAVSFAMPTRGGVPHLALAAAAKAYGVDPKRLKIVVFKSSGESIVAVAGGHVQAMGSSLASVMPQVRAGTLRVLAITARERRGGAAAMIPTLREQGIASDGPAAWRGLSGPPGLTAAQVAFWDETLPKVVETAEWKAFLDENDLAPSYLRSRDFAKYVEGEYRAVKAVMNDLGLLK